MRTFERADRALEEGKLWRAKEILEGSLPNHGYDPQLYERLGIVLLRMGDLPRAGMFLFLSGVRKDAYLEPIEIYKQRYSAGDGNRLRSSFPRNARLASLSEYPEPIASELRGLGLKRERHSGRLKWLAIAALVIGLLVAGIVKVLELLR
jgi:hypothetical protein